MLFTIVSDNSDFLSSAERVFGENERFQCIKGNCFANRDALDALDSSDAIIVPGNEFGFPDCGFYKALCDHYGSNLSETVMDKIRRNHGGYLPVGRAVLAPVKPTNRIYEGEGHARYIVYAPCYRNKEFCNDTLNVYTCVKSALDCIHSFNLQTDIKSKLEGRKYRFINRIYIPDIGITPGDMNYAKSVNQIAAAFEHFQNGIAIKNMSDYERIQREFDQLKMSTILNANILEDK
jgi:hypothetical protein